MQGQLALTGLEWCDFVIWNLGGISVERIYFDEDHCKNLKTGLLLYKAVLKKVEVKKNTLA